MLYLLSSYRYSIFLYIYDIYDKRNKGKYINRTAIKRKGNWVFVSHLTCRRLRRRLWRGVAPLKVLGHLPRASGGAAGPAAFAVIARPPERWAGFTGRLGSFPGMAGNAAVCGSFASSPGGNRQSAAGGLAVYGLQCCATECGVCFHAAIRRRGGRTPS
jgi:hypothetical protein